jgi:predicted RNase H-like HicB family nuclease
MSKYVYPAIFEPNELNGYCVYFPDLEKAHTHGDDMFDAMDMARDVLCLALYGMEKRNEHIPKASCLKDIHTASDNIVTLINCDTQFYVNWFAAENAGEYLQAL